MLYNKIYNYILDTKGFDLKIYNIQKSYTGIDYIILASANSTRHIQGIMENIKLKLKQNKVYPLGIEGDKENDWLLMDYGEVVLHLMTIEIREKYELEELYEKYFDAKKIEL